MNILVTGANGQLGNEMRALSAENGQHTYFFTDVQELIYVTNRPYAHLCPATGWMSL